MRSKLLEADPPSLHETVDLEGYRLGPDSWLATPFAV
jgi:hypothetical protein